MPHKHKRKRDDDEANFDLPPASRAKTLTVHQKQQSVFTKDDRHDKRKEKKRQKRTGVADDTPKAFARLMAFQQTGTRPSGLDDGSSTKKTKKKAKAPTADTTTTPPTKASTTAPTPAVPKILPHESLGVFAQRVDQSLPLTSLPKHQTRVSAIPGLENMKTPLTKHNKRLARMQSEWRATEQKLRERREEEEEDLAEKREEDDLLWLSAGIDRGGVIGGGGGGGAGTAPLAAAGKKKQKSKKKARHGALADDVDPWKVLEKKRREEGTLGAQKNLQDVVQAPPVLKSVKNIFKEKHAPSSSSASASRLHPDVAVPRAIMT